MKNILLILVLLVSSNAIGQDINPNGWDHAAFTHPYHNQNTGNYILVGDRTGSGHTWCDTDIVPFARGGQISVHRIWNDRGGNAILNLHGGTDWATAPFNYVIVDEASRASFASNMDNTRGYFLAPENDPNTPRTLDPCFEWPAWPTPTLQTYSYLESNGPITEAQNQQGDYDQQSRERDVLYTFVRAEIRWYADYNSGDTTGAGPSYPNYAEAAAAAQILVNNRGGFRNNGRTTWVTYQIGESYTASLPSDPATVIASGTSWQSTNGFANAHPDGIGGPAVINANN